MTAHDNQTYRPIADYALIGDAHTAALVSREGSIDWCCWPQFDSPAVFCRLLDARKGGSFRVSPSGRFDVFRRYRDATNVLCTNFHTQSGQVRLTDFMPVRRDENGPAGRRIVAGQRIVRLIEGVAGRVEMEIFFRPTFDYARATTSLALCPGGAVAQAGGEWLALTCPVSLQQAPSGGLVGTVEVSAGHRIWLVAAYGPDGRPATTLTPDVELDNELAMTLEFWQGWSAACRYRGPYRDQVLRSALALKLLTFAPSGALVAAPTTSLPEEIGGVRNWDYRFTWLRDSALILFALQAVGYHREAIRFFDWLESLCIACRSGLQIMYTINGSAELPEQTLDHLEGYRGSRPVRIGNAASRQTQLDIYGEVLDAADFCFERMPRPMSEDLWAVLRHMADEAVRRWREPDDGIWEVRGGPRHFLYSKLLCWVALDRALRLADRGNLQGDIKRWRNEREAIRQVILTDGYDTRIGAFTQTLGESHLDATALVVPLVGFLPATDPRVRSTMARIRERLTADGLVYRYRTADGLPGSEATFVLCSFWLVDNLALSGQIDEARSLFERLTGYANDLGLLSEEIDPSRGELLGNFPQGFSHLALIRSALHIAKAEALGPEEQPRTQAEREPEARRSS